MSQWQWQEQRPGLSGLLWDKATLGVIHHPPFHRWEQHVPKAKHQRSWAPISQPPLQWACHSSRGCSLALGETLITFPLTSLIHNSIFEESNNRSRIVKLECDYFLWWRLLMKNMKIKLTSQPEEHKRSLSVFFLSVRRPRHISPCIPNVCYYASIFKILGLALSKSC